MNYTSIYHNICNRGMNRIKNNHEYYEKHHIIPKCLGGSNDKNNITHLTAREHFIAHWVLCKLNKNNNIQIKIKLASAFNRMCWHNSKNRKITSKQFNAARKEYSINHPMKSSEIRTKVSESHKKRSLILKKIQEEKMPFCLCGCGNKVINQKYKYLYNHWDRSNTIKNSFTTKIKQKLSEKAKLNISLLTIEEKKARLKNSLHSDSINHIERGKNISKAKKGKKTNQREISGRRYANMSNKEFQNFLKEKISKCKHKNLTNLRNIWMNQQ